MGQAEAIRYDNKMNESEGRLSKAEWMIVSALRFAIAIFASWRLTLLSLVFLACITSSTPCLADQATGVWLAPPNNGASGWEALPIEYRSMTLVDLDEEHLIYLDKDSATKKISSKNVQALEIHWATDLAREAFASYSKRSYGEAIQKCQQAIGKGDLPRWQQKCLAAYLTDSLVAERKFQAAGRVFISLAKESPPALLYASAPLNWFQDRPDQQLTDQAQEWLRLESPEIAAVIGASWLLQPTPTAEALALLERRSRSNSPMISDLAKSQLWRIANPKEVQENFRNWQRSRHPMLTPLQLGPTLTIAIKLDRVNEKSIAAQEFLRASQLSQPFNPYHQRSIQLAEEIINGLGK
jgi:hypothetical protein